LRVLHEILAALRLAARGLGDNLVSMRRLVILAVVALGFCTAACASAGWPAPIDDFKTNVDKTVGVVSDYYSALNEYERHIYLETAFVDPSLEIVAVDASGAATPLVGRVFSAEAIRARTDALALVGVYARRLADLAGSKAGATFAANADALGKDLASLAETFSTLAETDVRAKPYVQPISTLVGVIGQVFLEGQRELALQKAVADGAPAVDQILRTIEDDLTAAVDPLRKSGEKQLLAQLVHDYNVNRMTWTKARRRRQITDIEKAAQGYNAALLLNPADVVSGLRDAHDALVAYARSRKLPSDLSAVASAMEIYAQRVDRAAQAVRTLRDLR
jgi:hypothetical protein